MIDTIELMAMAIAKQDGSEWDGQLGGRECSRNKYRDLARAAQAAQWHPIETAPRSGEYVLVFMPDSDGGFIDICYWRQGKTKHAKRTGWFSQGHASSWPVVTHWMPLPQNPATS
jgi:hypothetical protein